MAMQKRWKLAVKLEQPEDGGYPIPKVTDFEAVTEAVPSADSLAESEILVKHAFISPDPYIVKLIMTDEENVGKTVWCGAVGHVVASRSDKFAVGTTVVGGGKMGAREYSVATEDAVREFPVRDGVPLSVSLGVCGMPGVTAYMALTEIIGEDLAGKTIAVTGAAGAVGSAAGQVAKNFGARVVGFAGSDEKCAHCLEKFGFDVMLNYKSPTLADDIAKLGPVHGFYDNTGGSTAKLIKEVMVDNAPVANVGNIGGDSSSAHDERLNNQGFFAGGKVASWPPVIVKLQALIAEGKLKYDETILSGIDSVPDAFIRQRTGKQLGKMIIAL